MSENEDLLDMFAAVALMGAAHVHVTGEVRSKESMDALSRSCYAQAQSMLRVRQEFATTD